MYHQHLEKQIKKHLGDQKIEDERIQKLLDAVSHSYYNYERDKELSEHAFEINEIEYQAVNKKLKELTNDLELKIKQRTKDLEDIAQFPIENPNPIFRVNSDGEIIFCNPSALPIKNVIFEDKKFTIHQFFKTQSALIDTAGTFDLISNNLQYLFYYRKIEGKDYYNFYGADVTERNILRKNAQQNFQRLRNFLENAEDAYYMIYIKDQEKNFITNKWNYFFGFNEKNTDAILKNKCNAIIDESAKKHLDRIKKMEVGEKISMQYQSQNVITKQKFWLSEVITKQYDLDSDDIVISGRITDITKDKLFEQNLYIEKEKLEMLTRNSPDIIVLIDQNGTIEYVSPTAERILGFEQSEMLNESIQKFLCRECVNYLESLGWLNNKRKSKNNYEFRMVKKDGSLFWVDASLSTIKNNHGQHKILMHNRDIDALKKSEEILKESEQKYRGLFENMELGIMEVDNDDKIQWVNQSFEKMTGYTLRHLKGKDARSLFLTNENDRRIMENIVTKRKNKNETIYEISIKNKRGEKLDMVISGSPIIDLSGKVKGSVGIHWNVTEIRKMEKMIEQEKLILQQEIMKATINAEEKQREMFGNELHDGVGHILTYTSLYLQKASGSKQINEDYFTKAHEKVEEAINEVRRISRNLVPPALIDLSLKEAIIELFNQFDKIDHIQFEFKCKQQDLKDIDLNAQRNIYRIIQELLNNTIKHAAATKVNLTIQRNKSNLIINYYNNGQPFNPQKIKKSVGLNSINNRAYFYNGTTKIDSSKNNGTTFTIELPLSNIISHG
jgi:PAS domain S-box-containing protein